jgi:hypothetical protein
MSFLVLKQCNFLIYLVMTNIANWKLTIFEFGKAACRQLLVINRAS